MEKKLLLWDLDYTLGNFDCIVCELGDMILPDGAPIKIQVREHIHETLQELSKDYFSVITTRSSKTYAQIALERSGLYSYFENVYTKEQLCDNITALKNYCVVFEDFGYSQDMAKEQAIIIGDMFSDRCDCVRGVSFIHQKDGHLLPAHNIVTLLSLLEKKNPLNFNNAISQLYLEGSKTHDSAFSIYKSDTLRCFIDKEYARIFNIQIS